MITWFIFEIWKPGTQRVDGWFPGLRSGGNGVMLAKGYKLLDTRWVCSGDVIYHMMTIVNTVLYDWKLIKESEVSHVRFFCDTMDCSLPGSSIHGIFQARILEWVAISLSRGSSQTKDRTQVSHVAGRFFNSWTTREAQLLKE